MSAYLTADRELGAPATRQRIAQSGLGTRAENEALLELENRLESAVAGLLGGS